jgi:hypothetical protein
MRFIKRLIFIVILLLLAFFVYRLINPSSANALLRDLKSFSNTTIGTHFSLTNEVLQTTWTNLEITGTVLEATWLLQELTGDDELLFNDIDLSWENELPLLTWSSSSDSVEGTITTTSPIPSTPTSSSNELSHKDTQDAQNLLGNFK